MHATPHSEHGSLQAEIHNVLKPLLTNRNQGRAMGAIRALLDKRHPARIADATLFDVLTRAEAFVSRFERDSTLEDLQGTQKLLEDLRSAMDIGWRNIGALALLADGASAAREVVSNWERGNLAGAVNALEDWQTEAEEVLASASSLRLPGVVVEVAGGLVTGVSTSFPMSTVVVDYDNGGDEDSTQVPLRDEGDSASFDTSVGETDPDFVQAVLAAAAA